MILGVFIEFFGVKIAIGLSKNRCNLFITVGFDFGSNLTFEPLDQASDFKSTI